MLPVLLSVVDCAPQSPPKILKAVQKVKIPKVAFANLIDNKALYLTSFDPNPLGGKDYTYLVNDANEILQGKLTTPEVIPGAITWPNLVQKAPESLFGKPGTIISGGFLVPGKSNGAITFATEAGYTELFRAKGYFYHQVEFYDVDGDGQLDILTCRAQKPLLGSAKGDLTWLKPKDRNKPLGPWVETVLGKGCDTFFVLADVNGDNKIDIVAAEFWGHKLTIIESPNGRFDKYDQLKVTTIASDLGEMFGIQLTDVNGDGKQDLLVTNHLGDGNGGVYAFEIPAKSSDKWIRHDLSLGFPVVKPGIGIASPGSAQSFLPYSSDKKPSIVVAGDASFKAYLLTPNSEFNTNDWSFTRSEIFDCGSTVGGIAVGDVNNDGRSELYIPCYDAGYLAVYTY
jgi:hypothetical protein